MINKILNLSLFKFIIFQFYKCILSGKNHKSENVIQCDTEEKCFSVWKN